MESTVNKNFRGTYSYVKAMSSVIAYFGPWVMFFLFNSIA